MLWLSIRMNKMLRPLEMLSVLNSVEITFLRLDSPLRLYFKITIKLWR
jgi:hypothetical protein